MRVLLLFLCLFISACSEDSKGSPSTRADLAPVEQYAINADEFEVITPIPKDIVETYNLNTDYYNKVIVVWGIPILSPSDVDDSLLKNAANIVALQLGDESLQPDLQLSIRNKLFQHYFRIVIFSSPDGSYGSKNVPEFKQFADAAGYGATKNVPITGISERALDYASEGIPYSGNTLIHELTHSIHFLALRDLLPNFDNNLKEAYQNAIDLRLWENSSFDIGNGMGYISKNHMEYLAVGSELWHNVRRSEARQDRNDGISLHEHLRGNDFQLFNILNDIYKPDFSLNPRAGIYSGLYTLTCDLEPDEFERITGDTIDDFSNFNVLDYELYLDDKLYSISKLSSHKKRNNTNRNFIKSLLESANNRVEASIAIPNPLTSPKYYRANLYEVKFSYLDNEFVSCAHNRNDLI